MRSGAADPIRMRDWPGLLFRYVRTRPPLIRGSIIAALAYTVLAALGGRYAIVRWLVGLGWVALGAGLISASRRSETAQLSRRRRLGRADLRNPLEVVFALIPAPAVPRFQAVTGGLLAAAGGLMAASSVLAL